MAARPKKPAPANGARPANGVPRPVEAPTRQTEIETKLELDAGRPLPSLAGRKRLTAAGLTGIADPVTYHLDAVYYDTQRLDLLRSRITLRRRTGGSDAGWHLKLPARQGARTEVGLPLSAGEAEVPAEIGALVLGAARGRPLIPVARVVNDRTVRHLLDAQGTALVEVADDHVTGIGLIEGHRSTHRWRELEAELLAGTEAQLAATVEQLISGGATPASSPSKLARTLGFRPTEPGRGKTAGDLVVSFLRRQLALLIDADRAIRDGRDSEMPDARTPVQRMLAALTVFAPVFADESVPALRDRLRHFGEMLDAARRVESAGNRLTDQLIEEPADYALVARARLTDACQRRITAAHTGIREFLDSDGYLATLRDLDGLVENPVLAKRGQRAAVKELSALVATGWLRLREQVEAALADPASTDLAARARDAAAAMRYATESAVGPLGVDAAVLASSVEELQEALDEYRAANDAARLLAELAGEDDTNGVAGFIFGRLHAFEQAIAHGAIDEVTDAWDRIEDGELVAVLGQ